MKELSSAWNLDDARLQPRAVPGFVDAELQIAEGIDTLTDDEAARAVETIFKAITRDTGRAEGKVISIGRRVAFAEATLSDAAGKLYASATSTLLVWEA